MTEQNEQPEEKQIPPLDLIPWKSLPRRLPHQFRSEGIRLLRAERGQVGWVGPRQLLEMLE